ncbi:MAG: alpha/beta fold hydrolase [Thermomicrobiales bacterium]
MATAWELGDLHEAALRDGVVTYYERGSGDPLLFVHGLLYNADLWRNVVPELSAGHRCIVPDWPLGSHHPAMGRNADLSLEGLARLVVDFMDHLALPRVTLVGNDTGGAICQIVAGRHPERVERLILTNCEAFENFLPKALRPMQWFARVPGSIRLGAQVLRFRGVQRATLLPFAKTAIAQSVVDGAFRPARSDAGVRRDLRKVLVGITQQATADAATRLPRFTGPALIAWAEEDRLFPAEHADRLAEILPDARVVRIPNSFSFIPEDQPSLFTYTVEAFLRQHPAAAA